MTLLKKINKTAWSASSINKFIASPSAWLASYVYDCYGSGSPAMTRGKATEIGYEHYTKNNDEFSRLDDAVAVATEYFNKDTALFLKDDDARTKERDALPDFIKQAIMAFEPFGKPTSSQNRLELKIDGIDDPFIGFDDFCFQPQNGNALVSIDLKTTHRLPSSISDAHKRQLSLYQAMKPEYQIKIAYCTTKKFAVYDLTLEDYEFHMEEIRQATLAAQELLSLYDDPKDLKKIIIPDFSSFYWNDQMRNDAKRIWGY